MRKKRMVLYCIGFIIIFVVICFVSFHISYKNYSNQNKINVVTNMQTKELNKSINDTINHIPIPGLCVIITNRNETIYSMQYGDGISPNSIFVLGSTSKAITATAVLNLLEENHIELNTPIHKYLSWVSATHNITIVDLLNHTSGISTYETIDNLKYSGTYGDFEYSNANYNLLGKIIESVSGDTFSDYVNKHIFSKLKMDNSFALSNDTLSTIVQGHKTYFGALFPSKTKVPDEDDWIQLPSGYLCASSHDMSNYLRFMLGFSQNNQQLFTLVQNTGVHVKDNPTFVGIFNDSGMYGLGWMYKNINDADILYHTGRLSNFSSISVLIPEKEIGISILCNMGDFLSGTSEMEDLYEEIVSILVDNKETSTIQKSDYMKQHIIINIGLLLILALFTLPAILYSITSTNPLSSKVSSCIFFLIHIVIPIILISIAPILGIPYEVILDFTPDIFLILIACSSILFLTGAWKLVSICFLTNTNKPPQC